MVAEVADDGSFRIVTREREPVRLGSGGGDMKHLSDDAIDRGIASLTRFRHIAEQWDAEITAMATSAVREAVNREDFVRRARTEANVEVEVISGTEEARLIHLGVLQSVAVDDSRHLVVDLGGGSTEFIVGEQARPLLLRSLKLGAIRLTDRFFPGGTVDDAGIEACRHYIRGFLSTTILEIGALAPSIAIASSGTAETLASLAGSEEHLDAEKLSELTRRILAAKDPKTRLADLDIDERRSDIIVGGAVLLEEITSAAGIERWEIADLALRAGIVFDLINRDRVGDGLHRLTDLRRQSVLTVAERFEEDIDHAEHTTDLALELFDAIDELHGLSEDDRDLLEAAGLLHDIGLYIAHSAHHRHSYYLVRHAEQLAGFTDHQTELIAQIARYHRKSAPKPKHPEWASLESEDQNRVKTMAAILRIAIGLDRGDRTVIQRVEARWTKRKLTVIARTRTGTDAGLEAYSANARASLLAEVVGKRVEVIVEPDVALRRMHPSDH